MRQNHSRGPTDLIRKNLTSAEQHQTDSRGADKKSFNIRVPQLIAFRIKEQALSLAMARTTLIQSIIVRHFENEGGVNEIESAPQTAMLMKLEAIRKLCDLIEQAESKRYGQLLFEIVKTRSAIFHSIDQTLGGPPSIPSWTPARKPASTSPSYRARRRKVREHALRPAVRWRAGVTSLQMWAQMAMRILVIAVALWATSAVALVWYWVGRYGGSAAHEYFARWILAWVFTQVLPLSFLSLRYRGGRYPAGSMYEFLNRSFYFGHSFAIWIAHYSLWALIPTALILFAVGKFLFPHRLDAADDQYVRGTDVIAPRKLARELRGDGIEIGGVRIPRAIESQHFLFVGSAF